MSLSRTSLKDKLAREHFTNCGTVDIVLKEFNNQDTNINEMEIEAEKKKREIMNKLVNESFPEFC